MHYEIISKIFYIKPGESSKSRLSKYRGSGLEFRSGWMKLDQDSDFGQIATLVVHNTPRTRKSFDEFGNCYAFFVLFYYDILPKDLYAGGIFLLA